MKLAFILAYRNLVGAGLRTWLNVAILSFAFVLIIFSNGILDGWNEQARKDTIEWEIGLGELRNVNYDPFDPFSIIDGHGDISEIENKNFDPIFLHQATIYPEGRMQSVVLKGIDSNQKQLKLPTSALKKDGINIPVIIGKRMAKSLQLKKGDDVLLRWRDKNGTYDATNINIVEIFDCNVSAIDNGQIWMDINKLWEITGYTNQATFLIANSEEIPEKIEGWHFYSQEDLLADLKKMISMKKVSSSFMYLLLLAIALLAIFDTQVLSIFRRQKEIGTYVALGMTQKRVVWLFTLEGTMYSILATIVGCIWGIPLLFYMSKVGMGMPEANQEMGVVIADRIYPVYGVVLILSTVALVVIAATIVSYLPSSRIARMNVVDAIKGKV